MLIPSLASNAIPATPFSTIDSTVSPTSSKENLVMTHNLIRSPETGYISKSKSLAVMVSRLHHCLRTSKTT